LRPLGILGLRTVPREDGLDVFNVRFQRIDLALRKIHFAPAEPHRLRLQQRQKPKHSGAFLLGNQGRPLPPPAEHIGTRRRGDSAARADFVAKGSPTLEAARTKAFFLAKEHAKKAVTP